MKTIRSIGTIVVIALAIYFAGSGLIGFQSVGHAQKLTIEKTIPSDVMQYSLEPVSHLRQDKSIHSAATIISLVVAVIGIVTFRRKTNS